jgi:hypothetical protein
LNVRAEIRHLSRAVIASSAFAAALYLAALLSTDLWYRRTTRLLSATSGALFFALLVMVAGAVIQWPILRTMRTFPRSVVITTGAILAAVPFITVILLFRDPGEDPSTVAELVRFWTRVPGEFLIPFVPMAVAGSMLAWFATMRAEAPPNSG